jgi:hypothetical protein
MSQIEETQIEFWGKNPNALFAPEHILEFFPVPNMLYEQKLNAVTRTVLILCIIFYAILRSWRVVIIGILTILAIWAIYYSQINGKKKVRFTDQEGFTTSAAEEFVKNHLLPTNIFGDATETNPLQNVMLTDYDSPTDKKPAPASYTQEGQEKIMEETKKMINEAHPGQPELTKTLYQGLGDNLEFEQSMRPFYSTPNTMIPNDQTAFAEFCYGDMVSCKEGNPFACARNLARHTN